MAGCLEKCSRNPTTKKSKTSSKDINKNSPSSDHLTLPIILKKTL
jgi:hypothetical protein